MKHYWLYVLLLEQDKYYIGITSRKEPEDRIQEHFHGFYTAQWVKRYKPVKIVEVLDGGDMNTTEADAKELKLTREYMKKYGYQNVRGGSLNYSGDYRKLGKILMPQREFELVCGLLLMTLGFIIVSTQYFITKY